MLGVQRGWVGACGGALASSKPPTPLSLQGPGRATLLGWETLPCALPYPPMWGWWQMGGSFAVRSASLGGKAFAPCSAENFCCPIYVLPSCTTASPGPGRVAHNSHHAASCKTAWILEKWVSERVHLCWYLSSWAAAHSSQQTQKPLAARASS